MDKLSPLQEKIIRIFEANSGVLPSFRAIAKEIGVSSTNTVSYHVNKLKELGYLNASKSASAKVKFTLKNVLNLAGKPGVYVLLSANSPFYIGSAENLKADIIKNAVRENEPALTEIEAQPEKVDIAYHIVEDAVERESLKEHLVDFYKQKGFHPHTN